MKNNNMMLCFMLFITLICGTVNNEFLSEEIDNEFKWKVTFNTTSITVNMYDKIKNFVKIEFFDDSYQNSIIRFHCENRQICDSSDEVFQLDEKILEKIITIDGVFMGRSKLFVEIIHRLNNKTQISYEYQEVVVRKEVSIVDSIFTISLGIMVTIIFVSFGAALELESLKEILLKPIGPIIGFSCQFILMPVLSYLLGYLLFSDNTNMWLGLFFAGVTPGGGASNMWTLILKGNVNLSIVMTTISNLAAFFMMPFWIFTLGKIIFDRGNLGVPYDRIATLSVSLIVPLLIGLAIQKFQPKLAKILIRLLKPICIIILVFIITFAVITNLYFFKLFSWKIIIAGMGLPWFGYGLSYIFALLLKQNKADCLTISIETGLQNTGVAIFLLRFALDQPEADLTSIVPVSVSIMTKVPLLTLYFIQRFCCSNKEETKDIVSISNEEEQRMTKTNETNEN